MALEEGQQVESPDDFTKDPAGLQKRWRQELSLAVKEFEPWTKKVEKIIKRYRDKRGQEEGEGDSIRRLNLFWANVQTELPAVYQRPPKPQVGRRFKAKDPVARTAAAMLERYLEVDLERDVIDEVMPKVVLDRLLGGRGQVWLSYDPIIEQVQTPIPVQQTATGFVNYDGTPYEGPPPQPGPDGMTLMGSRPDEKIVDCRAKTEYLFWRDFLHSPVRAWKENRWVARRHYYTRDECAKEYAKGMEQFKWAKEDIPLTSKAVMSKDMEDETQNLFKRAEVWEVWDNAGHILFIQRDMDVPLEVKAQPVKFTGKWPCPKPYYGTLTNESLIPEPDFCQWQDLANEIDELTERITNLTKAIKMVGARSDAEPGLDRVLQEGCDNELIPVQNWAAFAEKGGIQGAISWLPLDQVMATVTSLNNERSNRIELAYQISGMSDLMRGQSDPATTATAERIKSNYGSLRIEAKQKALALFVEDLIQIKAEIIADMAPPEVLMMVSSIQDTDDAQFAPQACQLLKDERMRNFKIDVDEQSMAAVDDEQEKQERIEFLSAIGPFIQQVAGAMQQAPQMMDIAAESLGYVTRGFRAGRDMEGAVDAFTEGMRKAAEAARKAQEEASKKPPEPPPEIKIAQMQIDAQKEMAATKAQGEAQGEQVKAQAKMQVENAQMQADMQVAQMEAQFKAQNEQLRNELEAQRAQDQMRYDMQLEAFKSNAQQQTAQIIAHINAMAKIETARVSAMVSDGAELVNEEHEQAEGSSFERGEPASED